MSDYPTAFLSYCWENEAHKSWVRELAARLRHDGVAAVLDQWHSAPGDQLPEFMERAVSDNDFVLVICTPLYKNKSDSRTGGVGYEGDIMTGEVLSQRNRRKFIPVLRDGDWQIAVPAWLSGVRGIDLRGDPYSEDEYRELHLTLLDRREEAPPLGEPLDDGVSINKEAADLGGAAERFKRIAHDLESRAASKVRLKEEGFTAARAEVNGVFQKVLAFVEENRTETPSLALDAGADGTRECVARTSYAAVTLIGYISNIEGRTRVTVRKWVGPKILPEERARGAAILGESRHLGDHVYLFGLQGDKWCWISERDSSTALTSSQLAEHAIESLLELHSRIDDGEIELPDEFA